MYVLLPETNVHFYVPNSNNEILVLTENDE